MACGLDCSTKTETGKSKKSIWKKLRSMEHIHNNAQQITMAMGTTSIQQGLNQVWGPNPTNPMARHELTSKSKLELMCLEEAGRRFTQASHTLFLETPLVELFTEHNVYNTAFKQVLQGSFQCPPGTDLMAGRLLKALVRLTNITPILRWTLNEITVGWCKARESMLHPHLASTLVTTWQAPSILPLQYLMNI